MSDFHTFRVGNFDTEPWSDQITSKSYNLVFKTSCEYKRYKRIIPQKRTTPGYRGRFVERPSPRTHAPALKTTTAYEKDAEALEKSGVPQEKVIWIASGSAGGFVVLLTLVFILVRRSKAQRKREFMENNPIYGDDYYYNPIKADEEKVEYFDVTENNVEKQNSIN